MKIFGVCIALVWFLPTVFSYMVMPWMCLERCGSPISYNIKQIRDHAHQLTDVSFEDYDLRANGELHWNDFTSVNPIVKGELLNSWPMITTASISNVRQLIQSPDEFINSAVRNAIKFGYNGYNIDFEPPELESTREDAIALTHVLSRLAYALRPHGVKLSVDIGHETSFFDSAVFANATVDYFMTMGTYCGHFDLFKERFYKYLADIGHARLCVGMMTINPNTGTHFHTDEIRERFQVMKDNGVHCLAIWDMPVPDDWWPLLEILK